MAVLALVLLAILFRLKSPTLPFYSAVPLTSYLGSENCPSFAPDGERIAFSWDGEEQKNFDIYVKQIGVETPLRLTTDPGADLSPAWSPDGRTIAFLRVSPQNTAKVLLIPALGGGPERLLAEVTSPRPPQQDLRLVAWSPDGKWLAVPDASSIESAFGLVLLSVNTGEKLRLTLPPATYDDFDPAFSPDMTQLAFVRHTASFPGDLYILGLTRELQAIGAPRRLTFDHSVTSNAVWDHNSRSLLFCRSPTLINHSF
jgi:Tol biopolymer transport system component